MAEEFCVKHKDWVYVIGPERSTPQLVKIGYTGNLQNRIGAIRASSPVLLRVYRNYRGGHDLEQYLHREFDHYRRHGEWFRLLKNLDAIDMVEERWRKEVASGRVFVGCSAQMCPGIRRRGRSGSTSNYAA